MGESPAKKYYADMAVKAAAEKRYSQHRRSVMLLAMMHGPGFGEHDGHNSVFEQEVAKSLRFAYDALCVLSRRMRH